MSLPFPKYTLYKWSKHTIMIELDLNKLDDDDQILFFGKIYKEYQEENIETRARGGREESFTEKLVSKSKKTN